MRIYGFLTHMHKIICYCNGWSTRNQWTWKTIKFKIKFSWDKVWIISSKGHCRSSGHFWSSGDLPLIGLGLQVNIQVLFVPPPGWLRQTDVLSILGLFWRFVLIFHTTLPLKNHSQKSSYFSTDFYGFKIFLELFLFLNRVKN